MFGKLLGKSKEEETNNDIAQKVSKMNLIEMKTYVKNRISNFEICEDGLHEIMNKLLSKDENGKRFIETDAMDSKKAKAFELVILIAASKKVTITSAELIQEFIDLYEDIIAQVDKDNMQIYGSRLKDAVIKTIATIETMAEVNKKIGILGS